MADDKKQAADRNVNLNAIESLNVQGANAITVSTTGKTAEEAAQLAMGIKPQNITNIKNMGTVFSSPYGMFRSVPILCREDKCAYADVCMVPLADRIKGQRCPMEVAAILSRFMQYCDHFGISIVDNVIAPKDLVDATLIKDLVTLEVQQMRGENKIAISGDFMARTVIDIDRQNKAYYGNIVAPEAEHLLNIQQKKEKILNQLNATRKDKAQDKRALSPSEEAVKLFQKIKEMESGKKVNGISISDVEFDDNGNIIEDGVIKEPVQEEPPEEQKETKDNSTSTLPKEEPVEIQFATKLDPSWNAIDFVDEGE